MIHPFGPAAAGNAQASARIKAWVRQALALSDEVSVMVTELRCTEEGCPPLETCIAVLEKGAPRQLKIFKPQAEVTQDDVTRCAHSDGAHSDGAHSDGAHSDGAHSDGAHSRHSHCAADKETTA